MIDDPRDVLLELEADTPRRFMNLSALEARRRVHRGWPRGQHTRRPF
jgi:hypothetical protein